MLWFVSQSFPQTALCLRTPSLLYYPLNGKGQSSQTGTANISHASYKETHKPGVGRERKTKASDGP